MSESSGAIIEGLWNQNISAENYPTREQYQEHLFEQYKIFVEMTDRISARRNLANTFFLTLHTLLISAVGFLYEKGPKLTNKWLNIFPLVAVLALCYAWWRLLRAYRQLNTAKFKVIGEYEKRLPASPYWNAEWRVLGEGKDPKLYKQLTDIENWVPVLFACIYIVGAAVVIFL
jgi:hypothetical protein